MAAYCKAAKSLPLIADDVLFDFDDARAEEAIELLADHVATTTQVLLFTHREPARAVASQLVTQGRAILVDLDRAPHQ